VWNFFKICIYFLDVLNLKDSVDVYLKCVEYAVLYWYLDCGKLGHIISTISDITECSSEQQKLLKRGLQGAFELCM
jgi:hypothetical protein